MMSSRSYYHNEVKTHTMPTGNATYFSRLLLRRLYSPFGQLDARNLNTGVRFDKQEILKVLSTANQELRSDAQALILVERVWPKIHPDDVTVLLEEDLGFSIPFLFTSYLEYLINDMKFNEAIAVLKNPKFEKYGVRGAALDKVLAKSASVEGSPQDIVCLLKLLNKKNLQYYVAERNGAFILGLLSNDGHKRVVKEGNILDLILQLMVQENMVISDKYYQKLCEKSILLTSKQLQAIESMTVFKRPADMALERSDFLPKSITDLEEHLTHFESNATEAHEDKMEHQQIVSKLILDYCRTAVNRATLTRSSPGEQEDNIQIKCTTRVSELLKLMKSQGMFVPPGMKATLFEFYATCGDFESCKQMRHELPSTYCIQDFKVINVAKNFIRNNRVSEGIALLEEELEKRRLIGHQDTSYSQEASKSLHAANFVRCVSEITEKTSDPMLVDRVFELLLKFRPNSKPTGVMLASKIKVHLLNQEWDTAVDEFEKIVSKHGKVPLLGRLMLIFAEKNDLKTIQRITDIAVKVDGKRSVLTELAFAFIKLGKVEEAVKLLNASGADMSIVRDNILGMTRRKETVNLEKTAAVMARVPGVDDQEIRTLIKTNNIANVAGKY